MKALLEAVKTRLLAEVDGLAVEIVPVETYIPPHARTPFAGLKDGGFRRRDLTGGVAEETLTVRVAIYAGHHGGTEELAGAGLDMRGAVDEALRFWAPAGYLMGGDLAGSPATVPARREEGGDYLQQAVLDYEYIREV